MPRYNMNVLIPEVGYRDAQTNLGRLTDDALIARITPRMVRHNTDLRPLAWNAQEPEHDSLAEILRQQASDDLRVLFLGDTDQVCGDMLAISRMPTRLAVLFDQESESDDWAEYEYDNPVTRLQALGICERQNLPNNPGISVSDENHIERLRESLSVYSTTAGTVTTTATAGNIRPTYRPVRIPGTRVYMPVDLLDTPDPLVPNDPSEVF